MLQQTQKSLDMLAAQQAAAPGGAMRRRPASPRPQRPQEIYDAALEDLREAQRQSGDGSPGFADPRGPPAGSQHRSVSRRSSGGFKQAPPGVSDPDEMMGLLRVSGSSSAALRHSRDRDAADPSQKHHHHQKRPSRNPSPQPLRRNPSPQHLRRDPSPQHLRRDPSPQHLRRDPSPQHLRRDPSPQQQRRNPSPKALRPSLSRRSSLEGSAGLLPMDRPPANADWDSGPRRTSRDRDRDRAGHSQMRLSKEFEQADDMSGRSAGAGRRPAQQRPVPQAQGEALAIAGHRAGVDRQPPHQPHPYHFHQGPPGTEPPGHPEAAHSPVASPLVPSLRRVTSAPGSPKPRTAGGPASPVGSADPQHQNIQERSPSAGPSRLRYEHAMPPHPPGSSASQLSATREMTNSFRRKQMINGRRVSGAAAAIAELAEAGGDPAALFGLSGEHGATPPAAVRAAAVTFARSASPSEAVPSPKAAPASRGAQMLVDALRSKDDARLAEAINNLRGDSPIGAAMGINDLHPVTGRTPLYEAVALGRLSLVKQLLDAGADTEVPHATQGPPLLHAAAWGETEIVDALLAAGASLGARDCAAYTALHLAAIGGHHAAAASLLAAGADTAAVNEEGHTPLDLAAGERMMEVLSNGPQTASSAAIQDSGAPQFGAKPDPFAKSFGKIPDEWTRTPAGGEAEQPAPAPPSRPTSGRQRRPSSGSARRLREAQISASPPTSEDMSPPPKLHLPSGREQPEEDDGMEGAPPLARCATPEGSPRGNAGAGMDPFAYESPANGNGTPPHQPAAARRLHTPKVGEQEAPRAMITPPGSGGLGAKVRRGMRPGSGGNGPSARTLGGSPMATEVAQRTASGLGINAGALQHQAAQMFYQSVEVKTGDILWTRGELLGEGAYGKVYAGLNQLTGELMAVKVLPLNIGNGADAEEQRQHLANLEHELSLYRRFQHRHIVGYIATHMDFRTNTMYIFLEYVPGGSIASMLERFSAFSEELTRSFTRQLLLGLEYLHGCKVIHRDLKGGNVLVTRDGRVKLADFGASKAYHESTITDGMKSIRGSVFWMAPEVIKGTGYGRRADIWSVGCTVVEMLTGKHPWPELGDNHWTAMFQIAKTRSGPPVPEGTVSAVAQDFLAQCFKIDPRERPTVSELLQHPFVAHIPNAFREAEEAIDLNHSL